MKKIVGYTRDYAVTFHWGHLLLSILLLAPLVILNYNGAFAVFQDSASFPLQLVGWYVIYLIAFGGCYLLQPFHERSACFSSDHFRWLLLLAPLLFALKATLSFPLHFSNNPQEDHYWRTVFYWPALLLIVAGILWIYYQFRPDLSSFFGFKREFFTWKPYVFLLLLMIPLLVLAANQPAFRQTYPRLATLAGSTSIRDIPVIRKVLFELSYGCDFITIELFFRGLLVLGFIRWAGRAAILPMACFYCTIHFGKPVAECISSFFGGWLLGIIIYYTRSTWGGLLVHLGIAWLMELAGYIAS